MGAPSNTTAWRLSVILLSGSPVDTPERDRPGHLWPLGPRHRRGRCRANGTITNAPYQWDAPCRGDGESRPFRRGLYLLCLVRFFTSDAFFSESSVRPHWWPCHVQWFIYDQMCMIVLHLRFQIWVIRYAALLVRSVLLHFMTRISDCRLKLSKVLHFLCIDHNSYQFFLSELGDGICFI